jgi:hypothetical protein
VDVVVGVTNGASVMAPSLTTMSITGTMDRYQDPRRARTLQIRRLVVRNTGPSR